MLELDELERILEMGRDRLEVSVACEVHVLDRSFPVYRLAMGNPDPAVPAVGFFGGVHGLERIGTHVILYYLRSLLMRLPWDKSLQYLLDHVRLVFMPLVNPGGMWLSARSNPRGVDLMRNAPIEAVSKVPLLLGGHRISPVLPWYRGAQDELEVETLALCRVVQEELLTRPLSIALDCHSGFGLRDRIWFPYAYSTEPIAHIAEIFALESLFERMHPSSQYLFEPQSRSYCTHGDVWDYLYLQALREEKTTFLPLTLEMGSWIWVKKNPRQLFSRVGMFNPIIQHRVNRVLRRHVTWLDFLVRAACGSENWLPSGPNRLRQEEASIARWFFPK